jgi:hypothetical protein
MDRRDFVAYLARTTHIFVSKEHVDMVLEGVDHLARRAA